MATSRLTSWSGSPFAVPLATDQVDVLRGRSRVRVDEPDPIIRLDMVVGVHPGVPGGGLQPAIRRDGDGDMKGSSTIGAAHSLPCLIISPNLRTEAAGTPWSTIAASSQGKSGWTMFQTCTKTCR